jgi:AAHS family benzoate transporter-like MFS transporter
MYSGYSVGGIAAALLGIALLPEHDFRLLYLIGALPLIVVLPIAWRYLPESVAFLITRGRLEQARALAARYGIDYQATADRVERKVAQAGRGQFRALFVPAYLRATLLFAAASFCGLLLVYGLNTWLPQIMRKAGYDLGSSLAFLLVLNAGAVIGAIGASTIADRIGIRPVAITAFLCAAVSVILMSFQQPTAALFVLVALAGLGSVGTQILVNGYVATYYPDNLRATALGWSLGVGRAGAIAGPILGGLVAASALGYQWNFYLFAVVATLGLLLIAGVRPPGHQLRPGDADSPLAKPGRRSAH